MTGESATLLSHTEEDVLRVLELLASEAPARSYDELVARARRSGDTPRAERLERARSLALEVSGLFERRSRREADLASLVDAARDLTRPGGLDATLRLITRRARLMMNTDLACTVLLDEDTGDAVVSTADGAVSALTVGYRVRGAALPAGAPGEQPAPFWTADHLGDDPPTPAAALDEVLQAESLHAVLGVPLRADDRHLGHLYVAARGIRHFTPEEVALMCSLADLAAVAIGTARHLEDVHTANTELEESGARVRASLSDALRANTVQDELVRLVLDGAGLDELLARAATELGGSLAVQGQGGERLAERGRTPRPDPGELARVRLDAAATGIACPLSNGTWVLPLSVRSEDVGCLLFHPEDATAAPGEQILLAYARTVCLLLVMQRSTAVEGQVRDELLADLTTWDGPPDRVVERAGRFAAELHRPYVVVVAHARTGAAELVESWATAYARRHRGMKTVQGDRLVLLLPGEDAVARAREVRAELAGATGAQVTAGSCGPTRGADGVHPAYREAVRCLEALTALGGAGRSAAAAELGFLGMLLAEENDVTGFVERTLGPLLDHDAERFGNLVETLQGWFMAAGSPTRAAELLYVHPNTVSRRLERITQLLGRDWQHPDRALELQLALRLRRARTSLDPEPAGPPSP
ncbi:helix-turn-helix domain-containing protein (plasmid) [Streptomyces sp. NBC_00667]|nr:MULTISPECIES: helix-turn-helix domain-containing protein [unclassified Streptomyces]WUC69053.1 helix-turn-helix domain-containing protein [Streptomyces sp. NBC_00539]